MELVLNPKTSALVLIDLQNSVVARELSPYSSADVLKNCALLADTLRPKGGTIVFVRVDIAELLQLTADAPFPRPTTIPTHPTEIVPETGIRPGDLLITKRQWGAFYGTQLEQHLRRRGIQTIILGGIATNFGVESTARAAADRGYEQVFAEDAMSSINAEAHNFTVRTIFPIIGRVRTTQQIVDALR